MGLSRHPMLGRALTVLSLGTFVCFAQNPQIHYGSWMPMKDNDSNGIQIAFKLYADGTMYYKLKNTYSHVVKVDCQFRFTDKEGKTSTENACSATFAPGQERSSGGWWDANVASVDPSSLGARVRISDAPLADPAAAQVAFLKNAIGTQMWMLAQSHQGEEYRKGMQCNDLVAGAAKALGVPISNVPSAPGETVTESWFMHGMGPGFRPIVVGVPLSQLAQDEGNNQIHIPIGSVIVTNGHAALYSGVVRVENQWQLVTYDANATKGLWTISLSGVPSATDPSDRMLSFPGHQVGEHVTRLQWNSSDAVSVYQPIGSPALQ